MTDHPAAPFIVAMSALLLVCCGPGDKETAGLSPGSCQISSTPVVSIGGIEPPAHTFGDISDVGRLPDGDIAVADRQARFISIFDTGGNLVRTLGREGEGPGEFLDPIAVAATNNALLVWDWDQLRVTRFDLATDRIATYRVEGLVNVTDNFGDLPGGFVIGNVGFPNGIGESSSWTAELAAVRWDSVRGESDTLVAFRQRTSQWVDPSIGLSGSPTFSARGTFAAGNGRVYWTEGDSAVVHVWAEGGAERIVWNWPPRTVSPEHVDAYLKRWLARMPEQQHDDIREQVAKLPVAETFPTISDLVYDAAGGIWVGIYPMPSDTTKTWLRFENSQISCRLDIPRSFEPTEGSSDWLLGVGTDELDVERVELWSIESE